MQKQFVAWCKTKLKLVVLAAPWFGLMGLFEPESQSKCQAFWNHMKAHKANSLWGLSQARVTWNWAPALHIHISMIRNDFRSSSPFPVAVSGLELTWKAEHKPRRLFGVNGATKVTTDNRIQLANHPHLVLFWPFKKSDPYKWLHVLSQVWHHYTAPLGNCWEPPPSTAARSWHLWENWVPAAQI